MTDLSICEFIDRERKERHLSRRKLAILAGIPPSSLQTAMERNGKISSDMFIPILRVFDFPIEKRDEVLKKYGYWNDLVIVGEEENTDKEIFEEIGIAQREKEKHYEEFLSNMADAYSKLNTEGQQVAVERVQELTQIEKYQNKFQV